MCCGPHPQYLVPSVSHRHISHNSHCLSLDLSWGTTKNLLLDFAVHYLHPFFLGLLLLSSLCDVVRDCTHLRELEVVSFCLSIFGAGCSDLLPARAALNDHGRNGLLGGRIRGRPRRNAAPMFGCPQSDAKSGVSIRMGLRCHYFHLKSTCQSVPGQTHGGGEGSFLGQSHKRLLKEKTSP
jgi:hypothetical protein